MSNWVKKPLNLAHRGFSGKYPENTRIAFNAAVEAGCQGIETDVHFSKDGKLVIIHDPILGRTSNGTGFVKDYTYEELSRLDLGSWMSKEFSGERIMLFSEVLDFCKENNLVCNLEIKNYEVFYQGIEEAVINEIKKFKMQDKVILSSFNHVSMEYCKTIDKDIETGLLYERPIFDAKAYVSTTKANAVHPKYLMLQYQRELVEQFRQLDRKINVWTVNEEKDMKDMISLNVDSIITNYPDKLSEILRK